MPTYSRTDRLAAIQQAGFPDPITALAVSLAEFGENRDINVQSQSDVTNNGIREPSFGPWQIHLPSHPNVPQSCAMDLTCSTQQAFAISKGGTDFGAWSAYNNGGYKRFLDELATLIPPTSSPSTGGGSDTPIGPVGPTGPAPSPKPPTPAPRTGHGSPPGSPGTNPSLPNVTLPNITLPNPFSGTDAIGKFFADTENNAMKFAFVALGAGMIFFGAKLYLHEPAEVTA